MGEGKRRFRLLYFGSYALKGARRLKSLSSKEQRAEIIKVAKDPEAWGESLTDGWDLVKDESLDLKDAFFTIWKIQLGRRTSRKERRNAANKFALAGVFIPPLRVFSIPGSEMILGVVAFVMPFQIIPDRFLHPSMRSTTDEKPPKPSKRRMKWFQKERKTLLESVEDHD
ncbi:MAG TPA: hypothetical protein QF555_05580 [Candidatus Thalassarchaeaceae archaeon]|nr:hypothetical protein [Candidatus Thalassarchaeaceae archaeon]